MNKKSKYLLFKLSPILLLLYDFIVISYLNKTPDFDLQLMDQSTILTQILATSISLSIFALPITLILNLYAHKEKENTSDIKSI